VQGFAGSYFRGIKEMKAQIHETAQIDKTAKIGEATRVWCFVQVMENAEIGKNCIIGNGAYIDRNVKICDNVKIHNKACIYDGVIIEDKVFIGPHVICTNDKNPRHNLTRDLKGLKWRIREGASVGAGSVILPDVSIGKFAMVGAGSVVTKDVPDYGLVFGSPARLKGFVCECGKKLEKVKKEDSEVVLVCSCGKTIKIKTKIYEEAEKNGSR
jgi:acetyltransferase-like isoleucine patch superfamily enzyme